MRLTGQGSLCIGRREHLGEGALRQCCALRLARPRMQRRTGCRGGNGGVASPA